jgi:CHAT domain-containing protein
MVNNLRRFLQQDASLANAHLKYYEAAYGLHQAFVQPALTSLSTTIERLIIIPDGILNYIPFETLLTAKPTFKQARYEFGKMPYLIKDFQISYGYSATLLLEGLKKKKANHLKDFGGFAPKFSNKIASRRGCDDAVLGDLPYGRKNLTTINDIMQGNLHFDDEATLEQFKTIASEYNILHLCTHACAEDDFKNTRIYFSDQELLGFELYNLPIKAQLAVLSACETGIGEIKKGEGVMSLARAFMFSGCPSVVTSLWSVDDKSTSELMQYFYKNLKSGQGKDEALHQAKLNYLADKGIEASHPFYWAGFVQIGNSEAIYSNSDFNLYWGIGGLLLAIAVFIGFRRRKSV